jgi:hypothetical protein
MNRFLYALADPTTLIDPDGHAAIYEGGDCGPNGKYCGGLGGDHAASATANKVAKHVDHAEHVHRYQRWEAKQSARARGRAVDRSDSFGEGLAYEKLRRNSRALIHTLKTDPDVFAKRQMTAQDRADIQDFDWY